MTIKLIIHKDASDPDQPYTLALTEDRLREGVWSTVQMWKIPDAQTYDALVWMGIEESF